LSEPLPGVNSWKSKACAAMNSIPKHPTRYQKQANRSALLDRSKWGHQLQLFIERLFIESGFTDRR